MIRKLRNIDKVMHNGSMLWTLMLGFVAFTLTYVWLLVHRYRLLVLTEAEEGEGLARAIEARRAEGAR